MKLNETKRKTKRTESRVQKRKEEDELKATISALELCGNALLVITWDLLGYTLLIFIALLHIVICITYICLTRLGSVILFPILRASFALSLVSVTLIHLFLAHCALSACSNIPVEQFHRKTSDTNCDGANKIQFREEKGTQTKYGCKKS